MILILTTENFEKFCKLLYIYIRPHKSLKTSINTDFYMAEKESKKKIDDWDFETKYRILSPDLKLLHQVRLLRSDVGTLVYILVSLIPLYLAIRINMGFILLTATVLLYGFYMHLKVRENLKHKFEHAGTFG